jgi:xanthine dehydrogenase molybdenum-binding subunit
MNLTVNGEPVTLDPLLGEMLSDLLRERLHLIGTKIGCNEAECGTCTVLIDGEPVLSCSYPSAKAAGKNIITVEGLASLTPQSVAREAKEPELLHPLQEAFIVNGAVQCGFCIPGQLMTSYALLQRNPDPSEDDIRHALKDTLCRCAGYPTIIRSVQAAARAIRLVSFLRALGSYFRSRVG